MVTTRADTLIAITTAGASSAFGVYAIVEMMRAHFGALQLCLAMLTVMLLGVASSCWLCWWHDTDVGKKSFVTDVSAQTFVVAAYLALAGLKSTERAMQGSMRHICTRAAAMPVPVPAAARELWSSTSSSISSKAGRHGRRSAAAAAVPVHRQ